MSNALEAPVRGYPKLASYMGAFQKCAIYRRFSSLNARNLLYYQAELIHLEQKLQQLERADALSPEGKKAEYSRDWYWLQEGDSEQLQTMLDIRAKLKQYNDAMIQQSALNKLANPSTHSLKLVQELLERPEMGDFPLKGDDSGVWGSSDIPPSTDLDLLSLDSGDYQDTFSKWLCGDLLSILHHNVLHHFVKPRNPDSGIVSYSDRTLQIFASHLTSIVSSLVPFLSILVLYYVNTPGCRIGIIGLFMMIFAASLSLFTRASRGEIFMATSAFAAVQVVFISNN